MTWRSACVLALACGTAPVRADEPEYETRVIRWGDIVSAIERDPRVAAAWERARAAGAGVSIAAAPPNPDLEIVADRGEAPSGPGRTLEWEVGISLPLDWLVRRGPNLLAARAAASEAVADADTVRLDVTMDLWRRFVRCAYAEAELEQLEATEAQVAVFAAVVQRRVQAGEARPVELLRVEIELERIRGEVAAVRNGSAAALGQLSTWLGATVERVDLGEHVPPALAPSGPHLDAHPRVQAAVARANAASAEAAAARRGRIPSFSVGAFYTSEIDRRAAGARLAVELPLWNWKESAILRAEAAEAAETSRARAERRSVAAALVEATSSCARARVAAERELTVILPRAEESARMLERAFQLGETSFLDALDARRVLVDARRATVGAARERDLECGALALLNGKELP